MHWRPRLDAIVPAVLLAGVLGLAACSGKAGPKATAAFLPAPVVTAGEKSEVVQILDLLAALWKYDRSGRNRKAQKIAFEIPEAEVNVYLAYSLRFAPRPGIENLKVQLLPHNEVLATAVIDFDAVGRWNPGTVPVALQPILSGKSEIHLDAQWEARDGIVSFTLKDAYAAGHKAIPKNVAETIIRSIGSRQPEQYDTSRPIELPFGLQRVWTESQLLCGET